MAENPKTLRGKASRVYRSMRARVQGKCTTVPEAYLGLQIVPREVFMEWAMKHEDYIQLHGEWVSSGYQQRLAPSIDRIHPEGGYVLTNMQWVTCGENSKRANIWRWHGRIV